MRGERDAHKKHQAIRHACQLGGYMSNYKTVVIIISIAVCLIAVVMYLSGALTIERLFIALMNPIALLLLPYVIAWIYGFPKKKK